MNTSDINRKVCLPQFPDCTEKIIMHGDSMKPTHNGGDMLFLKLWNESYIEYGKCFLIVTKNGHRMLKRIRKGSDDLHVLCVSDNPLFDPFEILISDISELYVVVGRISKTAM